MSLTIVTFLVMIRKRIKNLPLEFLLENLKSPGADENVSRADVGLYRLV